MTVPPPPTIDEIAAQRSQNRVPTHSPWLHEEVSQRMAQRIEWLRTPPKRWVSWHPLMSGIKGHQSLHQQLASSEVFVVSPTRAQQQVRDALLPHTWWHSLKRYVSPATTHFDYPQEKSVDMVWANMLLHTDAQPMRTLQTWRQLLRPDGWLMLSCLGPDSLIELRQLYAELGWAPPCQSFTDMHDWGDMLLEAGFAEPVMDVETITLVYQDLAILLRDLRSWGRNLHPQRESAVAPKAWRRALLNGFSNTIAKPDNQGQFRLSFEIIYGHAVQSLPRIAVAQSSTVSLDDMRSMLGARKY